MNWFNKQKNIYYAYQCIINIGDIIKTKVQTDWSTYYKPFQPTRNICVAAMVSLSSVFQRLTVFCQLILMDDLPLHKTFGQAYIQIYGFCFN